VPEVEFGVRRPECESHLKQAKLREAMRLPAKHCLQYAIHARTGLVPGTASIAPTQRVSRTSTRNFASPARSAQYDEGPDPTISSRPSSIPNPFAPLMLSSYIEASTDRDKFKRRFRRNLVEMFLWMALGSMALKTKWQRMETEELESAARVKGRALKDEIARIELGDDNEAARTSTIVLAPPQTVKPIMAKPMEVALDPGVVSHAIVTEGGLLDKETKKSLGTIM